MSYETEHVMLHLNVGYVRYENNQDQRQDIWHGSLAVEVVLVRDWLRFVVNTGLQQNPNKNSMIQDVFVLGGLVFSPTDICDIDVGFKYSIAPKGAESPGADYTALAGVTVRFEGPQAKDEEKK